MKNLLQPVALAASMLAFGQCTTTNTPGRVQSVTYIDAGKQFVLGGGQPGAFAVTARNMGPVPVTVQERQPDGAVEPRGTLAPGQQLRLEFAAGTAALVCNVSPRQAVLNFEISGSQGLGMRYEALK